MGEDGCEGLFVGEAARKVGVAPQTLRAWEREGFIAPRRTRAGRRVYGESDVRRLREIARLRRREGLNFPAIRRRLGSDVFVPRDDRHGNPEEAEAGAPVGDRLRRLRVRAQKTLKDVSEATGLSVSFLSALERGKTGASADSLRLLARTYGTTMTELSRSAPKRVASLVRAEERAGTRKHDGVRFEELASGEAMDPVHARVPPGAGSGGLYSHAGEEFVHVTSGVLFVELKTMGTFRLEPGDTLYFPSNIPHRWWAEVVPADVLYVHALPAR